MLVGELFDLPESGSPRASGGRQAGPVAGHGSAEAWLTLPARPHRDHYRLREHVSSGGIRVYPKIFESIGDALDRAELILETLASKPHRRPYLIQVVDAWTGEIVTAVRPETEEREPGTCRLCGQPDDPFASGPDPSTAGETPPPSAPGPDAP